MNKTVNNRKKKSVEKIEKIFIQLIQRYEINEITVSDICKLASINRTTFYANYLDIYDLADKIKDSMFYNLLDLYKEEVMKGEHSYNYLKLFQHIKENQIYYKTMLKLKMDFSKYFDYSQENGEAMKYLGTIKNMEYHIEFFKAGMSAIITKWLQEGCQESPEEMEQILKSEYQKKNIN